MLHWKHWAWTCVVCIGLIGVVAWMSPATPARAQDAKKKAGTAKAAAAPQSFEAKFWDFLQSVQYQNWAPGPNQGPEPYRGRSPHGSYLKMYVNRPAAANPKDPPHGSIVVLENLGKDKKRLLSLTVMYRVKDFDPEHNDWYWIKYNADGTVGRTAPDAGGKPIVGRVTGCIECHAKSKGGDFYFANDK
jgi:hypothetical protein